MIFENLERFNGMELAVLYRALVGAVEDAFRYPDGWTDTERAVSHAMKGEIVAELNRRDL